MASCTSCGSWIPDDQGSSCSMCYGDVDHGHDGYYLEYMNSYNYRKDEEAALEDANYLAYLEQLYDDDKIKENNNVS